MSERRDERSIDTTYCSCDDIQACLVDYVTRDLGDRQSRVVVEHLRDCETCRREAARMNETVKSLREVLSDDSHLNARLSQRRLKRIRLAAVHPLLDWVYQHHRLVSLVLAIIVVVITIYSIRHVELFKQPELGERIPVWRMFRRGDVEQVLNDGARLTEGELATEEEPVSREDNE